MGDQLVGGGQNNQDMPSDGQYINFNFSWYFVGIDYVFVSGTSGVARRSACSGEPGDPTSAWLRVQPRVGEYVGEYFAKHVRWLLNGKCM